MHVTTLVTFHRADNRTYLELALRSFKNQLKDLDGHRLVVATCFQECFVVATEVCKSLGFEYVVAHDPKAIYYSQKMNVAGKYIDDKSDFVFFLQDDVVLSEGCLKHLCEIAKERDLLINPASNADNGSQFFTDLNIQTSKGPLQLQQNMKIEDFDGEEELLFKKISIAPVAIKVPLLATFCTLLKRKIWDELGGFDEEFKTGYEDLDFCMRAAQKHIPCLITLNTFCLHFQSVTANKEINVRRHDPDNQARFKLKWQQWSDTNKY